MPTTDKNNPGVLPKKPDIDWFFRHYRWLKDQHPGLCPYAEQVCILRNAFNRRVDCFVDSRAGTVIYFVWGLVPATSGIVFQTEPLAEEPRYAADAAAIQWVGHQRNERDTFTP